MMRLVVLLCVISLVYGSHVQNEEERKLREIAKKLVRMLEEDDLDSTVDLNKELGAKIPAARATAIKALEKKLKLETMMSRNMKRSEVPNIEKFWNAHPISEKFSLSGFVLTEMTKKLLDDAEDKEATLAVLHHMPSPLHRLREIINPDDQFPDPTASECPWPEYSCPTDSSYRSFDGSCNNLVNPLRGRAFTPFSRRLPAAYGNGVDSLRLAKDGSALPSAREVSRVIHSASAVPSDYNSMMVMQWGQFLDHDITATAAAKITVDGETEPVDCGTGGCSTPVIECEPIAIPAGDDFFGRKPCLKFIRSQQVANLDCTMGSREQINEITAYIDASNVYGSSKGKTWSLRVRDNSRGKLETSAHPTGLKDLLPEDTRSGKCSSFGSATSCNQAGDGRANVDTYLAMMHTLFVREHNRLEKELFNLNPTWNGERLYEETRKIVGAMMQHISYNEYHPIVVGRTAAEALNLGSGQEFSTDYDSSIDPQMSNVFSTAAYRFGHSLIDDIFQKRDNSYNLYNNIRLSETYFRTDSLLDTSTDGMDGMMRGITGQEMQSSDRFMAHDVTWHMFTKNAPDGRGHDLASLNIQRGRDHGLPGYNDWRENCNLQRANSFEELNFDADVISSLKTIYSHVDDIDLFAAGLAESPVNGGLVGETFACIINDQFDKLKRGDRFWYEREGNQGFTSAQLEQVRKVTLARVICDNGDNIAKIQPNVFKLPLTATFPSIPAHLASDAAFVAMWEADENARVNCADIPAMDLTPWQE